MEWTPAPTPINENRRAKKKKKTGVIGTNQIYLFDTIERLKKYETDSDKFIKELKQNFVFKKNQYAGVFVYNYEAEATSSEIKISNPAA